MSVDNRTLAEVRSPGAGIKCLYCTFQIQNSRCSIHLPFSLLHYYADSSFLERPVSGKIRQFYPERPRRFCQTRRHIWCCRCSRPTSTRPRSPPRTTCRTCSPWGFPRCTTASPRAPRQRWWWRKWKLSLWYLGREKQINVKHLFNDMIHKNACDFFCRKKVQ